MDRMAETEEEIKLKPWQRDHKLTIDWKGKIGYGDIVSPIAYAHNMAEKNSIDVDLNFHFTHSPGQLFKPQDPETINERIEFIAQTMTPARHWNVKVNQFYNKSMKADHTNYDAASIYHNLRFSALNSWNGSGDYIALVTTMRNKKQFKDYAPGKQWKDPLGDTPGGNAWQTCTQILQKQGYDVKFVEYHHPVGRACRILQKAKFVVGYHGASTWLARFIGAPLIIFSKGKLTRTSFPYAKIFQYWSDMEITNLDKYVNESIENLEYHKEQLNDYLTLPNIHRLR